MISVSITTLCEHDRELKNRMVVISVQIPIAHTTDILINYCVSGTMHEDTDIRNPKLTPELIKHYILDFLM